MASARRSLRLRHGDGGLQFVYAGLHGVDLRVAAPDFSVELGVFGADVELLGA